MSSRRRLLSVVAPVTLLTACAGSHLGHAPLDGAELSTTSDRAVVVTGIHGACDRVLEPEVTETPTSVRIRVPVRVQRGECTSVGLPLREEVVLQQPLGDRTVVDDGRDAPLDVAGR